jgi:xylulokinase
MDLGLKPTTTVVLGGHDQTCAAIGCGVARPGGLMLSCGTAWVVLGAIDKPLRDPGRALHSYCHAVPGGYAVLGAYAGGNLLRWLRDELWCTPQAGEAAYEPIVAAAEEAAASGRPPILFLPHFYGSSVPQVCPEARGGWVGLTLGHDRGDMALSLLTGVAVQTAATVSQLSRLGAQTNDIRMIGGGSRSRFWAQLVADALQRPVVLPAVSEAAAYGAALIAGAALGSFPSSALLGEHTPLRGQIEPRASHLPASVAHFEHLSNRLRPWWQALARTP